MYSQYEDRIEGSVIWIVRGRMSDEELDRHCRDIADMIAWRRELSERVAILLFFEGEPPSALQRKRLAAAIASPHYDPYLAIVSSGVVVRGVLTALRWMRGQSSYEESTHAEKDAALAWLEEKRGRGLAGLRAMVAALATDTEKESSPKRRR
jgi:hypothetical protein